LELRSGSGIDLEMPGLAVGGLPATGTPAKFDLEFHFVERPGESLTGSLTYATDLFDTETGAAIAERFVRGLRAVAADPEGLVGHVDVLGDAERTRVLADWNDTSHPVPEKGLPQLFAEQVDRTPDAVAVEFAGDRLTYRELDAWSNRLARA